MTENGFFGEFGGRFVPPQLEGPLEELTQTYFRLKEDEGFRCDLEYYLRQYVGRPSPLYPAERLTSHLGGAKIYLKREDLNHTGAHKINNCLGQALLARVMGRRRVVAETGAGQHGVATATAAALFGLDCVIYQGEKDTQRQSFNVFRMKLLGAEVISVTSGTRTLRDAVDAALVDYVQNAAGTFYMLGSAVGPHPYPTMVRDFQSIIGREARRQILEQEGRLPDYLIACVGGGSNAIGLFHPFVGDEEVKIVGVEPAGKGLETGMHAAPINEGTVGVIHGFKTYVLQDEEGEPRGTHSVAAGLDYPGVGPEHSQMSFTGRAEYTSINDREALEAFQLLSRLEGIIPALESAHAVAYAARLAPTLSSEEVIIVNLSGRGDKDVQQASELLAGD